MKIISHRGNLIGKNINLENQKDYIQNALNNGFEVECDVRFINHKFFLGHDIAQYEIKLEWLLERKDKLWIHCKNLECAEQLINKDFNFFWHQNDDFTITSKGILWCNDNTFSSNGITVVLNHCDIKNDVLGICTDEPLKFIK